ncbi:hypothetical protein ABZ319_12415 [Nocardia sp. NPDC005978]|uniref:hypothetical protein n=1 Tax=Nocardia sp. NPDC005978 TaxID=3156725 RepID=UPI0033A3F7AB
MSNPFGETTGPPSWVGPRSAAWNLMTASGLAQQNPAADGLVAGRTINLSVKDGVAAARQYARIRNVEALTQNPPAVAQSIGLPMGPDAVGGPTGPVPHVPMRQDNEQLPVTQGGSAAPSTTLPAPSNPQPQLPNSQPAPQNPNPAPVQNAKLVADGPIPGGPDQVPQPVVQAPPIVPRVEGQPWVSGPNQSSVVVEGTGGQTVDTTTFDKDGNPLDQVRAVSDGAGGATVWVAHADGSHSVTYVAPDGTQETYKVPPGGDPVNGATERIIGDGQGNWLKQGQNADGSPSTTLIEKQPDGITYYETTTLPGGGTSTTATRPGSPEFSTPWLVGETRPDKSGWRLRYDGSTKYLNADGSGYIEGGLDSTKTTFGVDQWGQPFTQLRDPVNNQIVTRVSKDANTDHPWTEIIISDGQGRSEAHYREGPDGNPQLMWRNAPGYNWREMEYGFDENRVVLDEYRVEPNPAGGEYVKDGSVVLGTITTDPDGTRHFKPTPEYGKRPPYASLLLEIIIPPDGKNPITISGNDPNHPIRHIEWKTKTQFGEIPGMPEIGSGVGPFGQENTGFANKFGTAFLGTYQGMLPLVAMGGPDAPGFAAAWSAVGKNVAKTAAIAALTLQYGPAGYTLANSGNVPGLNSGEANQIVRDLANSLGYDDFKKGNIGDGLGTLLGALVAGSGIGAGSGLVLRPIIQGAQGAIGAAVRAGARLPGADPSIPAVRDLPSAWPALHSQRATGDSVPNYGYRPLHTRVPLWVPKAVLNGFERVVSVPRQIQNLGYGLIEKTLEIHARLMVAESRSGLVGSTNAGDVVISRSVSLGDGPMAKVPGARPKTRNLPRKGWEMDGRTFDRGALSEPPAPTWVRFVERTLDDGTVLRMQVDRQRLYPDYTRGFADIPAPFKNADGSWTINLRMHQGWNVSDFDVKSRYMQGLGAQGKLVKRSGDGDDRTKRTDSWRRAREREIFNTARSQRELDALIRELDNQQIDHAHELQLGGKDLHSNMWALDAVTNHGMGGQINSQLAKVLDEGAVIRINILPTV